MLKYLEKTTVDNVTNRDIETIHHLVKKVKSRKEVGINYMKSWELERIYREEGREEGRQEGREEVIQALITTCQEFHASKDEAISKLREKFPISDDAAREYVEEYWE